MICGKGNLTNPLALNTFQYTLQFVKVGSPMEQVTKVFDTSLEIGVHGAVPEAGFKSINSVLSLPSEFEDHTFFIAEYSKIFPLCAI